VAPLVAARCLRHVVWGVYIDARVPDDLVSRARCLAKRLPPGAVISRRTAAWLVGLDTRSPAEKAEKEKPLLVECTVPLGQQPVRRPGVRGYAARLDQHDVQELGGLPVTTSERTAVDLLRWSAPHMGLAVVDAMAARALVDPSAVQARVKDFAGDPGVRQARYLAALVEPATESFGESWTRLRIADAGFPRPTAQVVVRWPDGSPRFRLDLAWVEHMVAVEYDGERHHSAGADREHDERRRHVLETEYGWRVLVAGRGEILGNSLRFERAVGDALSLEPQILRRRW
jgi:hypothetical protein